VMESRQGDADEALPSTSSAGILMRIENRRLR
jgi:hypothetical protein